MSSAAAPAAPAGAAGWAPSSGQAVNTSALSPEATTSLVQKYYGETLTRTEDLATGACLCAAAPPPRVRALLARLPRPVVERFYGCGSPLPAGCEGLRVVDLGCGSGRDAYVAAALVGPSGSVLGVDFTPQQLAVANAHVAEWTAELGYAAPNLRFVEGRVEDLAAAGVPPASVDVAISNCVVNLSPDKGAVLRSVWDSLAQGGELHFADVYCDRRLPSALRSDPLLVGECLGGALYVEDFRRLAAEVGFVDARVLASAAVPLLDERVVAKVGAARFTSITFRLFKLPGRLETLCEDYGQARGWRRRKGAAGGVVVFWLCGSCSPRPLIPFPLLSGGRVQGHHPGLRGGV